MRYLSVLLLLVVVFLCIKRPVVQAIAVRRSKSVANAIPGVQNRRNLDVDDPPMTSPPPAYRKQ